MSSIQASAAKALALYLTPLLPDVKITWDWAAPDRDLPSKAITVFPVGKRQDIPIDIKILKNTPDGDTQTDTWWQVAFCVQPMQLDVWTHSAFERDELMGQLDQLLHAGASPLGGSGNFDPIGHGILIPVLDGWDEVGTIADFYFSEPEADDTPESVSRDVYRATYTGDASFMLAVSTRTARQKLIQLTMFMNGETDAETHTI